MYIMPAIERKSLPAHIAKALGRKRNVNYTITDSSVECYGTWWDGGSRSSYHAISLAGGGLMQPTYTDEVRELGFGHKVKNAKVSSGQLVVCLGTFCGKPATPHIYIHPDDKGLVE